MGVIDISHAFSFRGRIAAIFFWNGLPVLGHVGAEYRKPVPDLKAERFCENSGAMALAASKHFFIFALPQM